MIKRDCRSIHGGRSPARWRLRAQPSDKPKYAGGSSSSITRSHWVLGVRCRAALSASAAPPATTSFLTTRCYRQAAASGVYLAELRVEGAARTARIVLLR
jgi:hypothetical protein